MIEVFGISNCNTVKKALDFLESKGQIINFHNFKKESVSSQKLKEWFGYFGFENVINKKSRVYRDLNPDEKQKLENPESAIAILQKYTSVIKRPVVEWDNKKLLGFDEADYRNFFPE